MAASLGRGGQGDFLNAASGNLLLTQQDEFLVGLGPDVAISRTYNSTGALDDNGDHWRQSTDRRVFGLLGVVNTASWDGVNAWGGDVFVLDGDRTDRRRTVAAGDRTPITDAFTELDRTRQHDQRLHSGYPSLGRVHQTAPVIGHAVPNLIVWDGIAMRSHPKRESAL